MNTINCSNCKKDVDAATVSPNKNGKPSRTCDPCKLKRAKYSKNVKCEHGSVKYSCTECGGERICEHGKRKERCAKCGGSQICEHQNQRYRCKTCKGTGVCEHSKRKRQCVICSPAQHTAMTTGMKIRKAIHAKNSIYNSKEFEHIGCTLPAFKAHIAAQFTEGMSWDNYGEWEIDHIRALGEAGIEFEEVLRRLHYTNTQPLWKLDNMKKGNKRV